MATNDSTIRKLANSLSARLGVVLQVSAVAYPPNFAPGEALLQIGPITEARMLALIETLDRLVPPATTGADRQIAQGGAV